MDDRLPDDTILTSNDDEAQRSADEVRLAAEAAAEAAALAKLTVVVKVILDEDDYYASVLVMPPVPVLPALVRKALSAEGIVFGINEASILEVAAKPEEEPVMVAVGIPVEHGSDASVRYFFRADARKQGKPLELEDGRVNHRELGIIENIEKGKILVTKIPPTQGRPGRTVRGVVVPPKPGKDLNLRNGLNTILTDDGLHIVAGIDGQPLIDSGRVSMLPLITVPKNVDYSQGNIDFQGSVKIGADVLAGFVVKATQDIEVFGTVEGATLEAGGKITCRGGVRRNASLSARGEISVRFVDSSSTITTWSNLIVAESAMHANLTAGLAIKVGKKLIGGYAKAGESVTAEQIGTPSGTMTHVDLRYQSQSKIIQQLERAIDNHTKQRNSVSENYQALQRDPNVPKERVEKTRELLDFLELRLTDLRNELTERLENPTHFGRSPFVYSRDGLFPGLHVYFEHAFQYIDVFNPIQRLSELNGEIVMG
jgi:uncharacterized protein (DUF342 family)